MDILCIRLVTFVRVATRLAIGLDIGWGAIMPSIITKAA